MSLESFIGMEQGEPMSAAALEKLREKMAAAQAQIAAIRKEEKKHKKKEQDLLKILLQFVKTSRKHTLVLLISRCLEQNLPANFILSIVLLSNPEIQQAMGTFLMLKGSTAEAVAQAPEGATAADQALTCCNAEDQSLPLKLKIEMDAWIKGLIVQAEVKPQKLLDTAYKVDYVKVPDEDSLFGDTKKEKRVEIQPPLIKLVAYIVGEYMEQNSQEAGDNLEEFAHFILKGILAKTKEFIDSTAFLEGDVAEEI